MLSSQPDRVLKFCIPEREEAVEHIEQEKKIYAILGHHPRIAHLHWASEQGLCFEYYPLGSLRAHYKSLGSSMPTPNLQHQWCQQATAGVKYIHSKCIVHGDISTRNILLSSSMNLKICDFGSSTMEGQEQIGMGETRYCRYRPLTEVKACFLDDIFSLGCLMYEILTGKPPYADFGSESVGKRYQSHTFPSLDNIVPHIYGDVIENCWNERYQSIQQVEEDLRPLHGDVLENEGSPLFDGVVA